MQQRRRFYLFDKILTNDAASYDWLNERSGTLRGNIAGRHEHRVSGEVHPIHTGLPRFTETPKLQFRARRRQLDFYGYGPYFVSARAKELFERIDAEAFEFEACETVDGRGRPINACWMMDVARLVERFDENRSVFLTYEQLYPNVAEALGNDAIVNIADMHMPDGFPDDWHAFRLARYRTHFVASGELVDAWRMEKLTGAKITPLQQPSARELRACLPYYNDRYWKEEADRAPRPGFLERLLAARRGR